MIVLTPGDRKIAKLKFILFYVLSIAALLAAGILFRNNRNAVENTLPAARGERTLLETHALLQAESEKLDRAEALLVDEMRKGQSIPETAPANTQFLAFKRLLDSIEAVTATDAESASEMAALTTSYRESLQRRADRVTNLAALRTVNHETATTTVAVEPAVSRLQQQVRSLEKALEAERRKPRGVSASTEDIVMELEALRRRNRNLTEAHKYLLTQNGVLNRANRLLGEDNKRLSSAVSGNR